MMSVPLPQGQIAILFRRSVFNAHPDYRYDMSALCDFYSPNSLSSFDILFLNGSDF